MSKQVNNQSSTNATPEADGSKVIALKQNMPNALFPLSIGQILDAHLAQYTETAQALLNALSQLQLQSLTQVVDSTEKLLTASQTAEMLSVCRQTVFDYAKRGLLITHRIGGRTYFKQGEVVAALQSQQQPTGRRKYARKSR